MAVNTSENYFKICRGCLSESSLLRIEDQICTNFYEITSIMISQSDCTSSYLCLKCLDALNSAKQFRDKCLKVDMQLKLKCHNNAIICKNLVKSEVDKVENCNTEVKKDYFISITDDKTDLKIKMENIENSSISFDANSICSDEDIDDDNSNYNIRSNKFEKVNDRNANSCKVCKKTFRTNEILKGHTLLHTSKDPKLTCPICALDVIRRRFTSHITRKHNGLRVNCTKCDMSFATAHNLRRHLMIHNGEKRFECNVCGKRFTQKVTMIEHKRIHERTNMTRCNICFRYFNEENLLKHREKKCKRPPSKTKSNKSSKISPCLCMTCGKQYSSLASLKIHVDCQHNNSPREHLCTECGKVVRTQWGIYVHAYKHRQAKLKIKPFPCKACDKSFSAKTLLVLHERVHTNERPFKCQLCSFAFKTPTHLRSHIITHTQEKAFGCNICGKFFALKGNLVTHMRIHTGERPYKCPVCSEDFIDTKRLKKHTQLRHKN